MRLIRRRERESQNEIETESWAHTIFDCYNSILYRVKQVLNAETKKKTHTKFWRTIWIWDMNCEVLVVCLRVCDLRRQNRTRTHAFVCTRDSIHTNRFHRKPIAHTVLWSTVSNSTMFSLCISHRRSIRISWVMRVLWTASSLSLSFSVCVCVPCKCFFFQLAIMCQSRCMSHMFDEYWIFTLKINYSKVNGA